MQQVRSLGLAWCSFAVVLAVVGLSGVAASGCADGGGGGGGGRRDSGTTDGEAPRDSGGGDGGATCTRDEDCPDDGVFCNGRLVCNAMGRCVAGVIPTCDDGITCTRDACVGASDECQNTPDDTMCPEGNVCYAGRGCSTAPPCEFDSDCTDDGVFCNGPETCVGGLCMSAGRRDCGPENSCAVTECVEAMMMCVETAYEHLTDPLHCGLTGMNDCMACPEPDAALHQVAICNMGACGVACAMGFTDRDMDPSNGCEYSCTPTGSTDLPDDMFRDANCDGIDGDRALAVFVSSIGSDGNDGLTPATPVATVTRALNIASAETRTQILFVTATYNISAAINLRSGISFYGGYSSDFTMRSDTRASIVSTATTAIRAQGLTAPVTIDRVNLTTADQSASSASTTTLYVRDSADHLTLRWVNVLAGRGGAGGSGGDGARGSDGVRGTDGDGSSGGDGGSVGGGAGADGRRQGAGPAGSEGSPGDCGSGGSEGPGSGGGGLGCGDGDPQPGGEGGDGCTGGPGGSGAAGDGLGSLAADGTWSPNRAGSGSRGGRGGGGGGGGAGGGEDCTGPVVGCIYCGTGRGGGGGGGGGQGGAGGTGGFGGGASIGVVLLNSTLVAFNVRVQTAGGGTGGAGGAGGDPGLGRGGGTGATSGSSTEGRGGNGGDGGNGGRGGCGGGGGGGPSIGIWGTGTSSLYRELTPIMFVIGAGGGGGSSCGLSGNAGVEGNTRQAFPG